MTQEKSNNVAIIEVSGPDQAAKELLKQIIFPMLSSIQQNFGDAYADQVYQVLLSNLIGQRIEMAGYGAVHEASGIISELEEQFFPEQCETAEQLLTAIDDFDSVCQPVGTEFLLLKGMPS
ncbi:hypothetical protein [Acinetobacter sp. ANC 3813]|uniref:hypothetical protein n=1 Tax=Acinetobacter sp. ANC 3813 TaxID=1977873 RepID=UPI000A3387FC|nr:hypothetical protein [Acinetobacter sp. ANC 3813]OTG87927.1 hypothetical protein B9T34_16470 [Acinetobacter sp. ANC 3813]